MDLQFIILILAISALVIFQNKEFLTKMGTEVLEAIGKDTGLSIGLIVIVLIVFSFLYHSFKIVEKTREDQVGKYKNGYSVGSTGIKEEFLNPAKLDYRMGKEDGIRLNNCPNSYWRHPPSNEKIITQRVFVPQGTQMPLHPVAAGPLSNGPSIDGTKDAPKSMFTFAYNQCRPECCPSTYSCDKGCVCTTEQQRKFIAEKRGNNKTVPENNEY